MTWDTTNRYYRPYYGTNAFPYPSVLLATNAPNLYYAPNLYLTRDRASTETRFAFLSNALPAYLELELGVLEPKARDQYQAFAAGSIMAQRFLSNRAGQVHLFRQRIPLRESVLYQAYHP